MEIVIGALILALGYAGAVTGQSVVRERGRVRIREMVHRERILALERGALPHELPEEPEGWPPPEVDPVAWLGAVRLSALAAGLVLAFGGLGILLGLGLAPDPELRKIWTMALIPLMAGVGLLVFHRLSRPE